MSYHRPINEKQRRAAWQMVWDLTAHPDGYNVAHWGDRWIYSTIRLTIACLRRHGAPLSYSRLTHRWTLASRWPLPVTLWPRDRLVAFVLLGLGGAQLRVQQLELELDALIGPVPS